MLNKQELVWIANEVVMVYLAVLFWKVWGKPQWKSARMDCVPLPLSRI